MTGPDLAETVKRLRKLAATQWHAIAAADINSVLDELERVTREAAAVRECAARDAGDARARERALSGECDATDRGRMAWFERATAAEAKVTTLERERDEAKAKARTLGTQEVCERWRSNNCSDYPQSDFDVSLCHVANCPRKRAHSPAAKLETE